MSGADSFFRASAGHGDLFGASIEPNYSPFGGTFASDNPMLGMAMQFGMSSMFGGEGFMGGQFVPTQNLYDQVVARQYQASRMKALQDGFRADQSSYVDIMRGVARMTGTPFGLEQRRAANVLAGDAAAIMPFIAPMAPQTFDAMHGPTGSRGLLADAIFRRGVHDVDPTTGLVGLTAESAAARSAGIFRELYETGPAGAGLTEMRGMGAGVAGQIYVDLQRRGMSGMAAGLDPTARGQARALDGLLGGGGAALPGGFADAALQGLDSKQAAGRIKSLAGAVSAMRDIFGDAGHPDAPIPHLIKALNDLTQGGLSSMSPERMETMVRTSAATAKHAGVTIDALAGQMASAAEFAASRGLDRSFGADAATRSISFGAAMGDVGRLDAAAFGRLSKAEYTIKDAQLRVQAAASPLANQLGALLRYQDEMGPLKGRALEIATAAREGRSVRNIEPGEFLNIMTSGGMSADTARAMIDAKGENEGSIQKYGLGNVARKTQPDEVRQMAALAFQQRVQGRLLAKGMSQPQAMAAARRAGEAASGVLFDPNAGRDRRADLADDTKRRDLLAGAMQAAGLSEEDAREAAVTGFGEFGRESERRLGLRSQAALDAFNPRVMKWEEARNREAAQVASMQKAMSSLGKAGPMARLVDLLKNPTMDKDGKFDLTAGVAKFLGAIDPAALGGALDAATTGEQLRGAAASTRVLAISQGVQATHQAFERARAEGKTPAELAEMTAQIEAMAGGGAIAGEALKSLMARSGLGMADVDDVISGKKAVDPMLRQRIRGLAAASLKGGGMHGAAQEAGVNTKSQVSAVDASAAHDQMRRVAGLRDAAMRESDPAERAKKMALADRVQSSGIAQAKALADAALGDEASIAALGAGGLSRALGTRQTVLDMEAIAKQQGKSVQELLSSEATSGPEAEASRRVRQMAILLEGQVGDIRERLADPDSGKYKLSAGKGGEKEAFEKHLERESADAPKRASEALKAILARTGGSLSDDEVDKLSKTVGSGDAADLAIRRLERAGEAYDALESGVADPDQRKFLEAQAGSLTKIGKGGSHVGTDAAISREALADFLQPAAAGGGAGKPGKMEITGEVTVNDGKMRFKKVIGTSSTPTINQS